MLNSVLNGDWSNSVPGRKIPEGSELELLVVDCSFMLSIEDTQQSDRPDCSNSLAEETASASNSHSKKADPSRPTSAIARRSFDTTISVLDAETSARQRRRLRGVTGDIGAEFPAISAIAELV